MTSIKTTFLTALLFTIFATTGCVQHYATPSYAQSGGMIQIGLGGIKRNANSNTITPSDITATIKDSSGAEFPLTISYVFRVYPDNGSRYIIKRLDPNYTATPINSVTEPYDGGWYANVFLTDTAYNPLPLAAGAATISISSPKLTNLQSNSVEGNLDQIKVKILPGTTTLDTYQTEQFFYYAQMPHLLIKPNNLNNESIIGGLQIKIDYSNNHYPDAVPPQIVPSSHDPNINILTSHHDNGDGTSSVTITMTNPKGFASASNWSLGRSNFQDLQLMVIPYSGIQYNWQQSLTLDMNNCFYIDINGNPLPSVTPTLEAGFIEGIAN